MTSAPLPIIGLLRELANLKRMRVAHRSGSLGQQLFEDAFRALVAGEEVTRIALTLTARAIVLTSLGGVDAQVLRRSGLDEKWVREIASRAFDALTVEGSSGACIDARLAAALRSVASTELSSGCEPAFVAKLARQPRAGATAPGKPRLILDPTESHAEHCALVAVSGVLLAGKYGAALEDVFLAALVHHLHNAELPDGGFAGEARLGDHLETVASAFRNAALAELPPALRVRVEPFAKGFAKADTPVARAFHAADVIDRVLQQEWHASAAGFTLDYATDEMGIVHAGPVQSFHQSVLAEAGLA